MMKENKDQLYIEHIVEAVDAVEKFISGSDYNEFKSESIWNTVKNDLPTFKKELLKIKL